MKKKLKWYSIRLRTILLILVIITAFVGCIGYRLQVACLKLPIGQGTAGPAVSKEPFKTIWSERPVVLVGIGDSITHGFGAPGGLNYFDLLVKNDNTLYPDMAGVELSSVLPKLQAVNLSQDYTVTRQHLEGQLPRLPVYPSEVMGIVVITSGGNDLIHDYGRTPPCDGAIYGCTYDQAVGWTGNIESRIKQLIDGVQSKFPGGCRIFIANIYDPTDGVSDPQAVGLPRWPDASKVLGLMNDRIASLCRQYPNVYLVDIHSEFLGHGIHCLEFWRANYRTEDPHFWYYHNLEDPNVRGYDAIRRLFISKMGEVLPPSPSQ